ncbi:DUF167 domain-containing protein [Nitratireductor basaltis]|uniref:UPF0235 protein EL18_02917 n=1 Tax=Nitratireductor basaltis TaxID=472175 RepID=A0A084U6S7_9HYPH|nr:DUF167 domain-containing protein [Nitratireductor basaltis]KFB08663.1 hypothetical protein EL18_02917 [Nitratireductor basaltis]
MAEGGFFTICSEGIRVRIRVTPKAARDAIGSVEGVGGEEVWLKARVRAVPEDGRANRALEKLLAKTFHVAKSDIAIESGQTSRRKVVLIRGNRDVLAQTCMSFAEASG